MRSRAWSLNGKLSSLIFWVYLTNFFGSRQNLFYEDRYSHTHQQNPDFVPLAKAMRVGADTCFKPSELEEKLKWLIEYDGPALLEVITDRKVPVLPMVPSGRGLHEFLVYDEGMQAPD